jgi:hypothetical protein
MTSDKLCKLYLYNIICTEMYGNAFWLPSPAAPVSWTNKFTTDGRPRAYFVKYRSLYPDNEQFPVAHSPPHWVLRRIITVGTNGGPTIWTNSSVLDRLCHRPNGALPGTTHWFNSPADAQYPDIPKSMAFTFHANQDIPKCMAPPHPRITALHLIPCLVCRPRLITEISKTGTTAPCLELGTTVLQIQIPQRKFPFSAVDLKPSIHPVQMS